MVRPSVQSIGTTGIPSGDRAGAACGHGAAAAR